MGGIGWQELIILGMICFVLGAPVLSIVGVGAYVLGKIKSDAKHSDR